MKNVEKVLVYLTREKTGRLQLLVFEHRDHAEAGIQIPGGTADAGESLEQAALREMREESGLLLSASGKHLGRFEWIRKDRGELHFRNVFHFQASSPIADEWLHTVECDGEDKSLVFRFYWMDVEVARTSLAVNMGAYLPDREGSRAPLSRHPSDKTN